MESRRIINNDYGIWGGKVNSIQQELADGINEVFERLLLSETYASLDGGKASSVYTTIQIVNGGGEGIMAIIIQHRNDTAVNWTAVNPILAEGEIGIENDTRLQKLGTVSKLGMI